MFGHFTFHLGVSVHEGELGEDVLKPCRAVLLGVVAGFAHAAEDFGALAVLGRRDLFEVGERPIHHIAVDVVDLHTFSPRSDPSLVHEMVAEFVAELAHLGVLATTLVVLHARGVARFDLAEGGTVVGEGEEVPAGGAEQWFVGRASLGGDDTAVRGVDAQPLRGIVGRCALGGHVPEGVNGNR